MTSSMSPIQPTPPDTHRRHPVVITLLTLGTLLSLGLVLRLVVTGFIWTPWEIHAFPATNDEELTLHYAQVLVNALLGLPLTVLGLTCGHFAAWLAWPEPPLPTHNVTLASTGLKARTTSFSRIAERAKAAGAGRMALIIMLLVCLVFGYVSSLLQGFYVAWRLIFRE